MKIILLLHFDFPSKLGGQKVCLTHAALCCNHPKRWLYHRVMHPKDADVIANSADLDQTAHTGAV